MVTLSVMEYRLRQPHKTPSGRLRVQLVLTLAAFAMVVLAGVSCERRAEPGTKRVQVWTIAMSKPAALEQYVRSQVELFEQQNPGVDVEWVDVPFDAMDRKLIAAAAAGKSPDVVNLSDIQFGRFVGLGALRDLNGLLPGDANKVFLSGALSMGKIGSAPEAGADGGAKGEAEGIKALPWYLTTQISLMNTQLLQAGGFTEAEIATTWSGLREQAKTYHTRTGKWLFSQPLGTESQLPIMMLGEGLVPLQAGTGGAAGRLRAKLDTPDIVAFVRSWVDLYRSGAMPPEAATQNHSHLTEMYQNGRLAMIDTGPNFVRRVQDVSPQIFAATRVRQGVTGALGRQHIATMVFGVMSTSKEPQLAGKLAWHLAGAASQTQLCRTAMVLPSTIESLNDPVIRGDQPMANQPESVIKARGLASRSLPDAVAFTPALVCWPDLRRVFNEEIKRALLDGEDVQVVLRRIEKQWDRILDASGPATLDAVPTPGPVRRAPAGTVSGVIEAGGQP